MKRDDDTGKFIASDNSPFNDFEGSFLYNSISKEIYYIQDRDTVLVMNASAASSSSSSSDYASASDYAIMYSSVTVPADSFATVTAGELGINSIIRYWIKDTETDSDTNGTYINPEGILTISGTTENETITLYNHSDTDVEAEICYFGIQEE